MQGFASPRFGVNLSAGTGLCTTGTALFASGPSIGVGMLTTSTNASFTVTLSVAGIGSLSAGTTQITSGQVVLSNSNGFSFGANGQTITAQYAGVPMLEIPVGWGMDNAFVVPGNSTAGGSSNLRLQRISALLSMQATIANIPMAIGFLNTGSTLEQGSYTISIAAYTMSGSTASLASSNTVAVSWTAGNTSATSANSATSVAQGQSGTRWRSIPLSSWNLTPGEYLIALILSNTGVAGSVQTMSAFGRSGVATVLQPGTGNFSAYFNVGAYSTSTTAFPASIQLSEIQQTQTLGANSGFPRTYMQLAGTF